MEAMGVLVVLVVLLVAGLVLLRSMVITVEQGTCVVITSFGKYRRVMGPGLNYKLPVLEKVHSRLSIQNRSVELAFQATTVDQANVNFSTMLLYAVADGTEDTIVRVAFKFVDQTSFMQALTRTIEGTIRSFVATKKQAEILGLRTEIVGHVKDELDNVLADWGYHLIDLQVNDISFGAEITRSMERVVASQNEKVAAENEGAALLIRETKRAEAEGAAIKIAASAEMEASRLRGQGVAAFREEVARGMAAAAVATEDAGLDPSFVLFAMWTESLRHVAEAGRGNLITLDGSVEGMERTMRQMMAASGSFQRMAAAEEVRVAAEAAEEEADVAGSRPGTSPAEAAAAVQAVVDRVADPDSRAAPGWYADPQDPARRRWWDGRAWGNKEA
ncbi:MAG: SPFH domain-containing protein [Microthrixaceae bacterium]